MSAAILVQMLPAVEKTTPADHLSLVANAASPQPVVTDFD